MKKKAIILVQTQLNARGLDAGQADGILGPKTETALDRVDGIPPDWSRTRKAVAFIQLLAKEKGIDSGDIDGYWGPQTEFAFDSLVQVIDGQGPSAVWRPEELVEVNPNTWPRQTPEDELRTFYGEVGLHQVRITLPYSHRLAWNTATRVNSFQCHEKVHDSLKRVLTNVLGHYGLDEIQRLRLDMWGGCLNVRQMRGGSRYSTHSWGIALDYDPARNKLKWGRDKAAFAGPEYEPWWRFWEEEGWVSLGRTRNFDWMHVQAAKL